jgi:hypothetical protein
MLTFVIAVILTMRQVEQTGVHFELTIRPVTAIKQEDGLQTAKKGQMKLEDRRDAEAVAREAARRPGQGEQ